ncbi:hypothetical protein CPB83DRAFT_877464 [Crepidotus variabilis]|uniref:CUE domain-containing protein n=1 Tax=Crepidotus variabilis TaxID=179855 RepID=A0A9P6E9G6_9AGAR|nr:hypothetical protein CPB83DRAFT_877464 [Crepidotus variabilis]
MGELVNVVVAFAVIVILFRWVTSGSESSEQRTATSALGFRPKNVTPEMVLTVSSMFPDIPVDNVRYDLLRTGSIELTTNKILERSYLDPPPQGYWTLYPRQTSGSSTSTTSRGANAQASKPKAPSLIARYSLQERINSGEEVAQEELETAGGKAVWEDSAERREQSLKERKAKMVLAARQKFLAQQAEKEKVA